MTLSTRIRDGFLEIARDIKTLSLNLSSKPSASDLTLAISTATNRANHTGTQSVSTIDNLSTALSYLEEGTYPNFLIEVDRIPNISDSSKMLFLHNDGDDQYIKHIDLKDVKDNVLTNIQSRIGWLSTNGKDIVLGDGSVFVLQGANYPGQGVPNGLDKMPYRSIMIGDVFREGMLDKVKRLGFNSVRLTVCEDTTWPGAVTYSASSVNPTLNPDFYSNGNPIPDIEVLDKLIAHCKILNIRVILDMHNLTKGYNPSIEGKWYSTSHPNDVGSTDGVAFEPRSEEQWIAAWEFLANRYKDEPIVCAYDLFNEPHDCTWDDDPLTGWPAAAERCATRIQAINPHPLIIVEGVPQQIVVDGVEMSSGWSAGLTSARSRPVVLQVPNKLVYSAHEYASYSDLKPAGVLDDLPIYTAPTFPKILENKFRLTWGHILENNFAPVFIGEFGAHLKIDGSMDPPYTSAHLEADTAWANELIKYHKSTGFSWCVWVFGDYFDTGIFDSSVDILPRKETFDPIRRLMDNSRSVSSIPSPVNNKGATLRISEDGFTPYWDTDTDVVEDNTVMAPIDDASVSIGANKRTLTYVSGNVQVAKAINTPISDLGKYYFEVTFLYGYTSSNCAVGLASNLDGAHVQLGYDGTNDIGMFQTSGNIYSNGSKIYTGTSFDTVSDTVMVAYDANSRLAWFGVNGTWINSLSSQGLSVHGTGQLYPAVCGDENSSFIINSHVTTCSYELPEGFLFFGDTADKVVMDAPIDSTPYVRKDSKWTKDGLYPYFLNSVDESESLTGTSKLLLLNEDGDKSVKTKDLNDLKDYILSGNNSVPELQKLLVYYGYPIAYKGIWNTNLVISEISKFKYWVVGDTYGDPTHEEFASTSAIIAGVKANGVKVYGYVPIGLSTSALNLAQMQTRVDQWDNLNVDGIFLDEFGFDYSNTRQRQIDIVNYVHSKGLPYCANAWTVHDFACDNINELPWGSGDWRYTNFSTGNPTNLTLPRNSTDSYMFENFCYDNTGPTNVFDTQERAEMVMALSSSKNFSVWALAVFPETTPGTLNSTAMGNLKSLSDAGAYISANAYLFGINIVGSGGFSFGSNGTPLWATLYNLPSSVPPPSGPASTNFTTTICTRVFGTDTLSITNHSTNGQSVSFIQESESLMPAVIPKPATIYDTIHIGSTPPSNPVLNQLWIQTS